MSAGHCNHAPEASDRALFELWLAMGPIVSACPRCLGESLRRYEASEPSFYRAIAAGIDRLRTMRQPGGGIAG